MSKCATSRQDVLKWLWDSQGPDAVWQIVQREAAARERGISEELRREAEDVSQFNSSAAERLVVIAEEIERIRGNIDQFAAIETVTDLLELYRSHPICHSNNFNRLLGVFWLDAIQSCDALTTANLRRGLKLLSNLYVAVNLIKHAKEMDPKEWVRTIQANEILSDPSFHEFLAERSHFLAEQGSPWAEGLAQMATYIRTCAKVAAGLKQIEQRSSATKRNDGFVQVRIPISPAQAELWFLVSRSFGKLAAKLAEEVGSGARTIESAMREASQFEARNPSQSPVDTGDDEPTIETFLASAFLEQLLRSSKPAVIARAIESYARLLTTGHWNSSEKRATFVLHYTKAVLSYWRYLENPLPQLIESADLIKDTLPTIQEVTSPRLMRDLLFTGARLLENVGFWRPEVYPTAIAAYEQGLSIAQAKHEPEARGQALSDYANTMSRMRTANNEEQDKKIIATYQEALTTFGMQKSVIGRTLALNSFAIYLNERLFGERSANQERALKLIQEAIDLLETDERADRQNDFVGRTLASAYLAKSSIIRKREVGDEYDSIKAAIDSLHTALDRQGGAVDNQLRGIIYLNLGHFKVELYSMTGETSKARDAMYAYREAESLLEPFPQEYSQALLGTAMLASEIEEYRSLETIGESIRSAAEALRLLENTEDLQARARGRVCFGELHSLRGGEGDFEIALESLRLAMEGFVEAGHYENAITAARRLAALWIGRFTRDGILSNVSEAEQVLRGATDWVERIWSQVESLEWRFTVSDRFSDVYAEIAWCQAVRGESPDVIASSLARSKGREFLTHSAELRRSMRAAAGLGDFLDQLRVESRRAERIRWRAARQARPDVDVSEATRTSRQQLRDIDLRRRLLFPSPSLESDAQPLRIVQAFLDLHPRALILDITVCRWGTVVLLVGGRETGAFFDNVIRVLPLREIDARRWVDEWSLAYADYLKSRGVERESTRLRWAEQTDALLRELSTNLMKPGLNGASDPNLELIIAAGRLAGLPLHATTLVDGRFAIENFESITYCPNISVLPSEQHPHQNPSSALFVVSDRKEDLLSAAWECQLAVNEIARGGTAITVLAQIGDAQGRAALLKRGVEFAADVEVLESAPTPQRLAELLPKTDHFFYSGHGAQLSDQSGLIVVDDSGEPTMLAEDDILSMHALRGRPIVVLSACETAMGEYGSAELFDTASSFLRVGARFVVGTLWVVVEDCATTFTAEFYKALSSGKAPSESFGIAARGTKQHRATAVSDDRAVPANHPIYWATFMAIRGS